MKLTVNLHTNFPDANGRIYPKELMSKAIEDYNKRNDKFIEMKPQDSGICLNNICGKIEHIEEKNGIATMDVEPVGYNGEVLRKLYSCDSLKVSVYGNGNTDDNKVVNDFNLVGFSIVSPERKKYIIIYHKEDNDGLLSASIMKHYLKTELLIDDNDIDLFPATYNELATVSQTEEMFDEFFEPYTTVIMTDVSFNDAKYMVRLKNKFSNNFIWIDHHEPIIKESIKLKFDTVNGVRDSSRSAILNAYKYCYDPFDIKYLDGNAPLLLRYLSAWDSWSWTNENLNFDEVRWFNQGITQLSKLNIKFFEENIDKFLSAFIDVNNITLFQNAINEGRNKCDADDTANKQLISFAGDFNWTVDGKKAVMIVTSGQTSSLMFKSLKNTETENGIVVKRMANGNWTLNLYNINDDADFHCGEYLKKTYGGGGHKGAAGCTLSESKFINILKKKTV